jgi:hypothetical protein
MKSFLALALLMLSPSAFASPTQLDGNDLLAKCHYWFVEDNSRPTTNMEWVDMGTCAGYLSGVTDVERIWKVVEGKTSKASHYCTPDEVTNGQKLKILKKWLDDNPNKLHERADLIIHRALLQAFPCK